MEDVWKVRMNICTALWSFVNFCCLSQSEVSTDNRKVSTFFAFQHVRCRCCYRSYLDRFLIPSAALEKVKRPIPFLTCSLYLDPVCREAILSRRHPVKNFAFGTCLLRQVSLWGVWRARPLRDGQTGNKKRATCLATSHCRKTSWIALLCVLSPISNLSCNKSGC